MDDLVKQRVMHNIYAGMASVMVGALAFMIARAAGVPVWYDGWVLPGDAADIGVTAGSAHFYTIAALRTLKDRKP